MPILGNRLFSVVTFILPKIFTVATEIRGVLTKECENEMCIGKF